MLMENGASCPERLVAQKRCGNLSVLCTDQLPVRESSESSQLIEYPRLKNLSGETHPEEQSPDGAAQPANVMLMVPSVDVVDLYWTFGRGQNAVMVTSS